jgi:hypothetical protein
MHSRERHHDFVAMAHRPRDRQQFQRQNRIDIFNILPFPEGIALPGHYLQNVIISRQSWVFVFR